MGDCLHTEHVLLQALYEDVTANNDRKMPLASEDTVQFSVCKAVLQFDLQFYRVYAYKYKSFSFLLISYIYELFLEKGQKVQNCNGRGM
jgi:hypothetical protein